MKGKWREEQGKWRKGKTWRRKTENGKKGLRSGNIEKKAKNGRKSKKLGGKAQKEIRNFRNFLPISGKPPHFPTRVQSIRILKITPKLFIFWDLLHFPSSPGLNSPWNYRFPPKKCGYQILNTPFFKQSTAN